MKKFLSLVLALVMTMSLVTISAGAKDFTDDEKITYEEAVNVISEIGVVDGYEDGTFKPQDVLTRGAAAKIICNMILGPTTAAELRADTAPFKDVPTNHTFAGYIAYCAKEGIISGYADGTFKPGNTLTGYAFMKMLLGALGYDANIEGYVGANWSISVAKRAKDIGLNNSLEGEFNGVKAVNREEAALYAFNTLQADLVEYDTSLGVNAAGNLTSNSIAKAQQWHNSATRIDHIEEDDYIQFAEQYFTKLEKVDDTDDFMRPAHTWTYDKVELGTYVDKDKLVESYTKKVTGRDVYDLLKAAAIRDNDLECWVDGGENTRITKADLVRSNDSRLNSTGNGVLTEIYLDTDDELITIVSINTYLAKATSSYSDKKEGVTLRVYERNSTGTTKDVDLVDVPAIVDVEKDQYYLVNMSSKTSNQLEVVALTDVEILADSTVTKFSQSNEDDRDGGEVDKLTTGGNEYKSNRKAFYDIGNVLDQYNDTRLTDMTYNVFLDPYGYFIGVDLFDGVKNYVFITGYDMNKSNLSVKTADAAAIFTDGTMKVIEVNVTDTNKKIENLDGNRNNNTSGNPYFTFWTSDTVGCIAQNNTDGNRQLNRWYTYTVDEDGVYTLNPAERMFATDIADITGNANGEATINCSNVRLDANIANNTHGVSHTTAARAYGEDASVFITVEADRVSTSGNTLDAIDEVTGVYTGVQDVDIEITTADKEGIAHSAYTLYDSDNYIIASIILGEATGGVANYAYILSGATSEAKIDGTYYWEFDAIVDGEVQTLTVKSKFDNTILDLEPHHIQELRYDGEYVVSIEDVDPDDIYAYNQVRIDDERVYDIGHSAYADEDECNAGTACPVLHSSVVAPVTNRTPITGRLDDAQNYIYLQGRTMYTGAGDQGLTFTKEAKAVVIQETNGDWDEEEYDSVPDAVAALADPNPDTTALEFSGRIVAILNAQGVAEWVVIISDTEVTTGTVNSAVVPTLTVAPSGTVNAQAEENVTLTVTVTNGTRMGDLAYQWYKNGAKIPGATDDTYTFTAKTADNRASFYCVVTNTDTRKNITGNTKVSAQSADVKLNIVEAPMTVTVKTYMLHENGNIPMDEKSLTFQAANAVNGKVTVKAGAAPEGYEWVGGSEKTIDFVAGDTTPVVTFIYQAKPAATTPDAGETTNP